MTGKRIIYKIVKIMLTQFQLCNLMLDPVEVLYLTQIIIIYQTEYM